MGMKRPYDAARDGPLDYGDPEDGLGQSSSRKRQRTETSLARSQPCSPKPLYRSKTTPRRKPELFPTKDRSCSSAPCPVEELLGGPKYAAAPTTSDLKKLAEFVDREHLELHMVQWPSYHCMILRAHFRHNDDAARQMVKATQAARPSQKATTGHTAEIKPALKANIDRTTRRKMRVIPDDSDDDEAIAPAEGQQPKSTSGRRANPDRESDPIATNPLHRKRALKTVQKKVKSAEKRQSVHASIAANKISKKQHSPGMKGNAEPDVDRRFRRASDSRGSSNREKRTAVSLNASKKPRQDIEHFRRPKGVETLVSTSTTTKKDNASIGQRSSKFEGKIGKGKSQIRPPGPTSVHSATTQARSRSEKHTRIIEKALQDSLDKRLQQSELLRNIERADTATKVSEDAVGPVLPKFTDETLNKSARDVRSRAHMKRALQACLREGYDTATMLEYLRQSDEPDWRTSLGDSDDFD